MFHEAQVGAYDWAYLALTMGLLVPLGLIALIGVALLWRHSKAHPTKP